MKSLGKRKTVLFVLIATALMLLMIEGASRGAYTFLRGLSHVRRDRWFLYSPEVGWMPRANFSGPAFGGGTREFDENSFLRIDSEQVKDRTEKKVLFLGDSNTFGWKVPTESTFVEHVDRNLPGVSAINAGVIGDTSYQGLKTLERIGSRVPTRHCCRLV